MRALRIQPFRVNLEGAHSGTGPESISLEKDPDTRNLIPTLGIHSVSSGSADGTRRLRLFAKVFEVYDLMSNVVKVLVMLIKPT